MPLGIYQTPTFSPHAHLQTLLKPTVLALVPVVLIDGTVPVPSTRVCEISSYTSLEEALATCNKMDPIIHQVLFATFGSSEDGVPEDSLLLGSGPASEGKLFHKFRYDQITQMTRRHFPEERSQLLIYVNLM